MFGAAPTNAASVDVAQYLKDNPGNGGIRPLTFNYAISDHCKTLVWDWDETWSSADKITPQQAAAAKQVGNKVTVVEDGESKFFMVERPGEVDYARQLSNHGHDHIVQSRNTQRLCKCKCK